MLVDTSVWIPWLRGLEILAIEHETPLLHDDRDFAYIAKIEPALRLWPRDDLD